MRDAGVPFRQKDGDAASSSRVRSKFRRYNDGCFINENGGGAGVRLREPGGRRSEMKAGSCMNSRDPEFAWTFQFLPPQNFRIPRVWVVGPQPIAVPGDITPG
jgi:hypothetical protein